MQAHGDGMLLRRFQLCRADIVATLSKSALPPSPQSLRMLADLQLSIMAVQAAIGDKSDSTFESQFLLEAAA
jgi:hypothetical protein